MAEEEKNEAEETTPDAPEEAAPPAESPDAPQTVKKRRAK